jgi:hypothetical protein
MIDRLTEFINSKAGYLSLFWIFNLLAVFLFTKAIIKPTKER